MRVCAAAMRLRHVLASVALSFSTGMAGAVDLQEPITLQSRNGILDILLVAKAATLPSLAPFSPKGWVYDICLNPHNGANDCPAKPGAPNLYGGTRLQLSPGDTLKIHLVNKLPPITDSSHAQDPDEAFLALNSTNIHTHGMLVSPHYPSTADPTYGDNVFVLTFNSANGTPVVSPHIHGAVAFDSTDYKIKIPAHHPSGLYWFHPHAHGIALNQVSAGMAGIITIGNVGDYVCNEPGCAKYAKTIGIRHIILKDTQVLAHGTLMDEEDPDFCLPSAAPRGPLGQGFCPGQDRAVQRSIVSPFSNGVEEFEAQRRTKDSLGRKSLNLCEATESFGGCLEVIRTFPLAARNNPRSAARRRQTLPTAACPAVFHFRDCERCQLVSRHPHLHQGPSATAEQSL